MSRLEDRLPPLLSVIAGMVDLIGFFTLGNIFTAHVTGNLVLAMGAAVRGGPLNVGQALAIPVFMLAVASVWFIAQASNKHGPFPSAESVVARSELAFFAGPGMGPRLATIYVDLRCTGRLMK